jgi:hypothetical protein
MLDKTIEVKWSHSDLRFPPINITLRLEVLNPLNGSHFKYGMAVQSNTVKLGYNKVYGTINIC